MKPIELKRRYEIEEFAEILMPNQSEPPILTKDVRLAVRQWMVELSSGPELEKVLLTPRKTALLSGPPGCGKTTLAHHFAARLGLPLIIVNMASLISSYVGSTGQNINRMFEAVQQNQQDCVLFLDEFDSIATKRTKDNQSAGKERNSIVISLLQKIDKFEGTLIAATNRGEDIDPAIWRRFGMHLEIKEPDHEARFAILKRYLYPYNINDDSIFLLTELTDGASPAVLKALMEGIKRDLVLSPKLEQDTSAENVFKRIMVSVKPHAEAIMPPLWKRSDSLKDINKLEWPPVLDKDNKEKKAA